MDRKFEALNKGVMLRMLKITNDGRKLALDQRLMNDMLPDEPESKVNRCVDNAFKVWEESASDKGTQLIFCDLSTPKADGTFNVYDDVREKLVVRGVPREEVAFIHPIVTLRQFFQFLHKGIRITGATCDDQLFIRLNILEGLNQISNALLRHQKTEEQYV